MLIITGRQAVFVQPGPRCLDSADASTIIDAFRVESTVAILVAVTRTQARYDLVADVGERDISRAAEKQRDNLVFDVGNMRIGGILVLTCLCD